MIGTNQDDVLQGTIHSDVMSGRFGDDTLYGHNGSDDVWGGTGDDVLYGNSGNDKIYGSGGPTLVQITSVAVTNDYPVSVVFEGETAGYRNTFGYYKVEDDGTIKDVEIIWPNASLQGSGGNLVQGQSREFLNVQAGDKIAFFIISNGYSRNGGYNGIDLDSGRLEFQNSDGTVATLNSNGPRLYHIAENGTRTMIQTDPYHTSAYGDTVGLNPDGILHTTGVLKADAGTITLGFEDLYNGGDRDFDDSVFTVDIGVANALVLNAHFQQQHGGTDPDPEGEGNQPVEILRSDNDILFGGDGSDELHGRSGDDELYGNNGHDHLHGGSGNDDLYGGAASDKLYGNSGDDILYGGNHSDELNGNNGNDTLHGDRGNDSLIGGSGNDTLFGGNDTDSLIGGSGIDVLNGGYGNDTLKGGTGNDTLNGDHDKDKLFGGDGVDIMNGGYGNDTLNGGRDNDLLYGGNGNDNLYGSTGDDTFFGDAGNDVINGGLGNDTVDYTAFDVDLKIWLHNKKAHGLEIGRDTLKYIDNINSGSGDDYLQGSRDANVIVAGGGDDTIRGLQGADTFTGGAGSDTYVYRSYDLNEADLITDFSVGEDVLDLRHLAGSAGNETFLDQLQASQTVSGLEISVDLADDGNYTDVCTFQNVQGETVTSLFDNGCFLF
ncbi:DUF4114 domain-containing protein [Roseibium sp. RKSG952]|nr:DUF4114 domain-containing protein [Roseibium sp. RKSG952]